MTSWMTYSRDISIDSLWICLLIGLRSPCLNATGSLAVKFAVFDALAGLIGSVWQPHLGGTLASLLYGMSLLASAVLTFAKPRWIALIPVLCCTDSLLSSAPSYDSLGVAAMSSGIAAWAGLHLGKTLRALLPHSTTALDPQ
jgi:hypothetical protein